MPTQHDTLQYMITVPITVEQAFTRFVDEIGRWWPPENTFANVAFGKPERLDTVTIEPREGGHWYERLTDGSTIPWGHVQAYEPPRRLVLTWQITPRGTPEPDPSRASEVEVRFVADGPTSTRIELEHRQFERHGHD
ncbi:MAG: SRPBCC family protein, partial [Chloroflexota bacterium]